MSNEQGKDAKADTLGDGCVYTVGGCYVLGTLVGIIITTFLLIADFVDFVRSLFS